MAANVRRPSKARRDISGERSAENEIHRSLRVRSGMNKKLAIVAELLEPTG